jgi:polyprenyl P-hydroxybenzoate/phenylacrylic acid decarboxylase-like protein
MIPTSPAPRRLALLVTGASGMLLPRRFLEVVLARPEVARLHLVVSRGGSQVLAHELGRAQSGAEGLLEAAALDAAARARVEIHRDNELDAAISSGSYRLAGTVVLPCSGSTLAAFATGAGTTLVARAGAVALKERWPLLLGFRETPLSIVHLDAHPDLYDEFEGDRYSHACPFARILEDGLARHLVQVGVRTMNPVQRAQADRFGVEVIPMGQWSPDLVLSFEGPVYVSVDLDVLDPAFGPGVSHHEPAGCSTRDVLRLVQSLRSRLVGADVVELNPSRDLQDVTARAAAKIVKELVGRLLEDH